MEEQVSTKQETDADKASNLVDSHLAHGTETSLVLEEGAIDF